MPFVKIDLPAILMPDYGQAISDAVQTALVDCFHIPVGDRFQVLTPHAPEQMVITEQLNGLMHGHLWCLVNITCNHGRTAPMKQALFAQISRQIAAVSPIASADVIIYIVEMCPDNSSVGVAA